MPEAVRPMLGDLELALVQQIQTDETQVLVGHPVPQLEGDFTQHLNRDTTRVRLQGVITGDDARDRLEALRQTFHASEPLTFVADIMTATEVQQMLIANLQVQEVAGKPDRFVYWLVLEEYNPPPSDETEALNVVNEAVDEEAGAQNEERIEDVTGERGVLEVEVLLASGERDFSVAEVEVEGTTDEGEPFSAVISTHEEGLFRLEDVPAGEYTVRAIRRE